VRDSLEELVVDSIPAKPVSHFTEIVLHAPYRMPQTKTVPKIKEHLASIYRVFIRAGVLELRFRGPSSEIEVLEYQEPRILRAPHYSASTEEPRLWRKS
jgi:hypothetical protein